MKNKLIIILMILTLAIFTGCENSDKSYEKLKQDLYSPQTNSSSGSQNKPTGQTSDSTSKNKDSDKKDDKGSVKENGDMTGKILDYFSHIDYKILSVRKMENGFSVMAITENNEKPDFGEDYKFEYGLVISDPETDEEMLPISSETSVKTDNQGEYMTIKALFPIDAHLEYIAGRAYYDGNGNAEEQVSYIEPAVICEASSINELDLKKYGIFSIHGIYYLYEGITDMEISQEEADISIRYIRLNDGPVNDDIDMGIKADISQFFLGYDVYAALSDTYMTGVAYMGEELEGFSEYGGVTYKLYLPRTVLMEEWNEQTLTDKLHIGIGHKEADGSEKVYYMEFMEGNGTIWRG